MAPIQVRGAAADDHEFILGMVSRLSEFGPPPWRDTDIMTSVDRRVVADKLAAQPESTAMFVAVDEDGTRLGYIHLEAATDYYEATEHGHVADLVVAAGGEGRGVARALMAEADAWAKSRGYRRLTLTVFEQNARARALYEHLGYGPDMMKYVKELD